MINERKEKRKIFFMTGEDYYFYTYNILVALYVFGCEKKVFRDHRKFAFLIDFFSNEKYINILDMLSIGIPVNKSDIELLSEEYSLGHCRISEITRLVLALEQKRMISIENSQRGFHLDIKLVSNTKFRDFFESESFLRERNNAEKFKAFMPRVTSVKFETFIEKLYQSNGVSTWQVS